MNLEDWKQANPGKSLNDYYTYARKNGITVDSISKKSNRSTIASTTSAPSVTNNSSQGWIKYAALAVVLIGLIATNPNETQHYNHAVNEASKQLKKEVGNWGILEGIKNIGSNFLTKATVTVDNRRNFLLFSIQDVNLAGEKVGTSVGVIGLNIIFWDNTSIDS
ncbi:DUF4359 domain-containing protein [Schleiferiaceae bacterium]|nr:DUF4359 domain-containing protein [Schleiferiaceae bacterium]